MKGSIRFIIIAVIILLLIISLGIMRFWHEQRTLDCDIQVKKAGAIKEEEAVSASMSALKEVGVNITGLVPRPYDHHSAKFFARNTINNNDGYILWGYNNYDQTGDRYYRYMVRLYKEGKVIHCSISNCYK